MNSFVIKTAYLLKLNHVKDFKVVTVKKQNKWGIFFSKDFRAFWMLGAVVGAKVFGCFI